MNYTLRISLLITYLIAILISRTNCLFAQIQARESFEKAMTITDKNNEDYAAPLEILQNVSVSDDDLYGWSTWCQAMMTYHSFMGSYDSVLYYGDLRYQNPVESIKVDTDFVNSHQFIDAAEYIIDAANRYNVTMINEAHHLPFHRSFTTKMLKQLYDKGYKILAVETLKDSVINRDKTVDYNTGYYTREPLFAEMLRYALKIGFTLRTYESNVPCNNDGKEPNYCNTFRDSVMAQNINKIIEENPSDKILIYAGYDHIHKGNKNGWKKMGEFITKDLGIDALSIDQTVYVEQYFPERENEKFLAVNNALELEKPVVALGKDSLLRGEFVDISVIHPRYNNSAGRPHFYKFDGLRKTYPLKYLNLKSGQIVQAFYADEIAGSRIPADQVIYSEKSNELYLFPGKYKLVLSESGTKVKQIILITVE